MGIKGLMVSIHSNDMPTKKIANILEYILGNKYS